MESQNGLITTTSDVASQLTADVEKAQKFVAASKSRNTRLAYTSDWKHFDDWCTKKGLVSLPAEPETIGVYLAAHGGDVDGGKDAGGKDAEDEILKPSTLARRVAAIAVRHRDANLPNPASMKYGAVSGVLRGIRRTQGTKQSGKDAIVSSDMRKLIAALPNRENQKSDSVIKRRDAALLLLGFCGAFRRSELTALVVDDLSFNSEGVTVTVRRGKTDQESEGRMVAIPFQSNSDVCAVRQLKAWLEKSLVESGPVFRAVDRHGNVSGTAMSDQAVRLVVMAACKGAGLDPGRFGAHSLRSGHVTSALISGAGETAVMQQTGHKSAATMRRYYKNIDLFKNNSAGGLL